MPYMINVYNNKNLATLCLKSLIKYGFELDGYFDSIENFVPFATRGYIVWYDDVKGIKWNPLSCTMHNYTVLSEQQFFEKFPLDSMENTMEKHGYSVKVPNLAMLEAIELFFVSRGFDALNEDQKENALKNFLVIDTEEKRMGWTMADPPTYFEKITIVELFEKFSKKTEIKVTLSEHYDAILTTEGITIGCQTFSFEKLEEVNEAIKNYKPQEPFTKDKLCNGDLVVYASGDVRMFLNDHFAGLKSYASLLSYNKELTSSFGDGIDINKVYRCGSILGERFKLGINESDTNFGNYNLIWERSSNKIRLNSNYSVEIRDNQVVCDRLTISFNKFAEIYKAAKEIRGE